MTGASFSFSTFALVAVAAAAGAMITRRPRRTLAGFAVAAAALIVPLIQLRAPMVAGAMLLSTTVIVTLLAGLLRLAPPEPEEPRPRHTLAFAIPAILGLGGFVWVLLATGSRQFVDAPPPLAAGHDFGDGDMILLALSTDFMVPAVLVGMLALCSVLAAVLALVAEPGQPSAPS